MQVKYSALFKQMLKNFPKADQLKIRAFETHVRQHGFSGLEGRNKSSADVPTDDPNWLQKVRQARDNNLWHYHIGIPHYDESCRYGDKTSKYVLHYIYDHVEDILTLVYMSPHPPFELPDESYLELI